MKKLRVFAALLGALPALLPTASSATSFTFTEGSASDIVPSFSFMTSLSGAALDNLAPGTDISSTVTPFTFQPVVPATDAAGFPLGGPFGSAYFNVDIGPDIRIGTNASGQITSWDITEGVFVSYPVVSGEAPTDFYATYTAVGTDSGDVLVLTLDQDDGLAPPGGISGTGSFGAPTVGVPAPVAGAGLPGLIFAAGGLLAWTRRKRQAAVAA
jgi:hypothetical protein